MATFVLVPGTGDGSWVWQKVARLLRAAGSEVYALTLTGVADRSHLVGCGVDLTTHITDAANLLFYEDLSNVVLVGHSYAGMVITGVAATAPERLKQLIYLDAYVPDEGQSELDLWPPDLRAAVETDPASKKGLRSPPTSEVMGITDPALAQWAEARMTAQPLATYTQAPPPGDARSASIPRSYISCTVGATAKVFAPFVDKARAAGWDVRLIAAGHEAMLIAPDEVAEVLLDLAGASAGCLPDSARG